MWEAMGVQGERLCGRPWESEVRGCVGGRESPMASQIGPSQTDHMTLW